MPGVRSPAAHDGTDRETTTASRQRSDSHRGAGDGRHESNLALGDMAVAMRAGFVRIRTSARSGLPMSRLWRVGLDCILV
jgi:hypothetical protein